MSVQDRGDREGRVGPFVTYVERVRPDGVVARWDSRRNRKHPQGAPATGSTWWAPRARGWWIAVLFAVGSLLFALGAVPGYASAAGARWDAATFFIGSLFFTAAGFLSYREAVDAGPQPPGPPGGGSSFSSPAASTGGPPPSSWPGPCGSTSAPGTRSGKTCPPRPRTSTYGGPTPSGRSPSWSPARCPGSRSATAGLPGAPGPGPGGSPCSTWSGPSPSVCPPWPATSTRIPASCTTPSCPTSAPSSAQSASSWAPCCSCPNAPRKTAPQ